MSFKIYDGYEDGDEIGIRHVLVGRVIFSPKNGGIEYICMMKDDGMPLYMSSCLQIMLSEYTGLYAKY